MTPILFYHRHQLVFEWLLLMHLVTPGPKTLANMARYAPSHIQEHHFRRLLNAAYWSAKIALRLLAAEVMAAFPAPEDRTLALTGDGSHKDKRGKNNPYAQKGKKNEHSFYFFGVKFVVLMAQWDGYRIPVDLELVRPKTDPLYQTENALFRIMVERFVPPAWTMVVVVMGDCAFASKANMKMILKRNQEDKNCRWYFLFAMAKTWKMANGKAVKDLATYIPRSCFQRTWISCLSQPHRRKTFWAFRKQVRLEHVGNVTLILSKKGRNVGPNATKILVTNLPNATTKTVLTLYDRRWQIEILFKELKYGLGLGQQQVSGKPGRVEKTFAIGVMAYLMLIYMQKDDIKPRQPWSIFHLKHLFLMRVIKGQVAQDTKRLLKKAAKTA